MFSVMIVLSSINVLMLGFFGIASFAGDLEVFYPTVSPLAGWEVCLQILND